MKHNNIYTTFTYKILYSNINSYNNKKALIDQYIFKEDIKCALFVETKTKDPIRYKDWSVIQRNGTIVNKNCRGGVIAKAHKSINLGKANPPITNNALNDCMHITMPFKDEKLHIFIAYIHPNSDIEETIFVKASLYKYAIIIGDLNVKQKKKYSDQKFSRQRTV